jgi:hypothetical protein
MKYSSLLAAGAATFAVLGATAASAVNYDTAVTIGYDANAATSNFGSPGTMNHETAYTVRTGIDSTNFYVDVTATPPDGVTPDQFANIYIGGANFAKSLIFEVTNNRVSTTDAPGTYYSLTGTGFTYSASTNDISFALPLSFLETDPFGLGFGSIGTGDQVRVSYAQAFGYSFVGGTANFGSARLGEQFIPEAAPAPEPATWAMMLVGFGAVGCGMRRRTVAIRFRNA